LRIDVVTKIEGYGPGMLAICTIDTAQIGSAEARNASAP
jgi:hypothetical protein